MPWYGWLFEGMVVGSWITLELKWRRIDRISGRKHT